MKRLSRNGILISLSIIGIIFLFSCATQQSSSKIDLEPKFKGSDLLRGEIAVFPVLIGEESRFIPRVGNFAQTAGEEIISALSDWNSELKLLNPTQVSSILEEYDLNKDYSNIEQQFRKTGELDINLIRRIVKPFNVQYFLFSSIDSLVGTESISYKPQANIEMSAKIYVVNTSTIIRNVHVREEEVVARVVESYPYENATIKASHSLIRTLISDSNVNARTESKFAFGYLAGVNFAKVYTADSFFNPFTEKAVLLTGLGQLHLKGPFYIQTQVQYLTRKVKFKPFRYSAENIEWSYDFIDIPVLIMFKSKRQLNIISQYVQIGPSICFNWNHSTTTSFVSGGGFSINEKRIKPVFDFSLVFGAGYEFVIQNSLKFYTSVQYSLGFYNMHKYETWKFRTYKIIAGFIHDL